MRNFLRTAAFLILAYLVLVNFTGFSKDIATIGNASGQLVKDFQGR